MVNPYLQKIYDKFPSAQGKPLTYKRPSDTFYYPPSAEREISAGTRVFIGKSANVAVGTTVTLYTVPTGKRLFITNAGMSFSHPSTSGSGGLVTFFIDSNPDIELLAMEYLASVALQQSMTMNYSVPIPVKAGVGIKALTSDAASIGEFWFIGFEEGATQT